jgi:hypothetical protein
MDAPFVDQLDTVLRAAGVATWFDKHDLKPGQKWEVVIEDEIPSAQVFLTCVSANALDKRGYFHVEQQLAAKAAMHVPSDRLFLIPVLLGDCTLPRELRQYHTVNLVEGGAIENLISSISEALNRELQIQPETIDALRNSLLAHLRIEATSNAQYLELFRQTDDLSWRDSAGLIERVANSRDPNRLSLLLTMRGVADISYAEQAALDTAILNVRQGRATSGLLESVTQAERAKIEQMAVESGEFDATVLLQFNKYCRYIARKNTQPYLMAEAKIRELLAGASPSD